MTPFLPDPIQVGRGDGTGLQRNGLNDHESLIKHCIQGTAPGRGLKARWSGIDKHTVRRAGPPPVWESGWAGAEQKNWLQLQDGFLIAGRRWNLRPWDFTVYRSFNDLSERVQGLADEVMDNHAKVIRQSNLLIKKLIDGLYEYDGGNMSYVALTRSRRFQCPSKGTPRYSVFVGFCGMGFFNRWVVE